MTTHEPPATAGRSLLKLLALEQTGHWTFRAGYVFPDPYSMFGGQVTALALRAAGLTVGEERLPHSLHGYFLRPGDASVVTDIEVQMERDGRSFSARRVVARQHGKAIFSMSASFHVPDEGPSMQVRRPPVVISPQLAEVYQMPRVFSLEGRAAEQEFPHNELRTRFWARCTEDLGDDSLLEACVLAYFSDITNGVAYLDTGAHGSGASIDNAVWFHRPARTEEWMLLDLVPQTAGQGRGWYTGSVFQADGTLVASLAQETLFRLGSPGPGGYFIHGW